MPLRPLSPAVSTRNKAHARLEVVELVGNIEFWEPFSWTVFGCSLFPRRRGSAFCECVDLIEPIFNQQQLRIDWRDRRARGELDEAHAKYQTVRQNQIRDGPNSVNSRRNHAEIDKKKKTKMQDGLGTAKTIQRLGRNTIWSSEYKGGK